MKKFVLVSSISLFAFVAQAQCPMCKTALEASRKQQETKTVGNGLNKGILYLLSLPYLAVGTVGGVYYFKTRKRKQD
jgi:hypothetical protein